MVTGALLAGSFNALALAKRSSAPSVVSLCVGASASSFSCPRTASCFAAIAYVNKTLPATDGELPDWRIALTPSIGAKAPAIMSVNFGGAAFSFEVKPGPEVSSLWVRDNGSSHHD
jgi:hypothetical protein